MHELLFSEIRQAVRGLRHSPLYSITAVLTLAFGIGANALAYTFANAIFLRPLPFVNSHELVGISTTHRVSNGEIADFAVTSSDFLAFASRNRTLSGLGAISSQSYAIMAGDRPQTVLGAAVSASMWTVLGTKTLAGRTFGDNEDFPGSPVAVISETLQRTLFPGAAGGAVGRAVVVDGVARTVIGVLPAGYRPRMNPGDIWLPMGVTPGNVTASRQMQVVGRMRPGVRIEAARADLIRVARELAEEDPTSHRDWSASVKDLRAKVGDTARAVTLTLLAGVGFLLLLTCANVTNLALVRLARRRSEISTRLALGASRASILRHQLLEALCIGLGGGVLGALVAAGGVAPALRLLTTDNPLVKTVGMDWRVLVMVFAVSVLTGVVCCIAPGLYALNVAEGAALAGAGRRQLIGRKEQRLRRALMTLQVAAAAVLLVGASGALATLRNLGTANVGFSAANVAVGNVTLPVGRYPNTATRALFVQQMLTALRSTPGIQSAAMTSNRFVPGQSVQALLTIDGVVSPEPFPAEVRRIDTAYFTTIGVPVLNGRSFGSIDREGGLPVVIVNRSFVQRYLPGRDPLGAQVKRGNNPLATIVGVVPDVMDAGIGVNTGPMLYLPYAQYASPSVSFVVKSTLDVSAVERALRTAMAALDPGQPLDAVIPLPQLLADSLGESRFKTLLLSVLSGLALIIACVGIYGVTAYLIAERTREVAIRIALGAPSAGLLRHFAADAGRWVAAGAMAGLLFAYAISSALGKRLPEVQAAGGVTYAGTGALLLGVGLVAILFPTLRALRMEPSQVLRGD